jgi:hypothetical protein
LELILTQGAENKKKTLGEGNGDATPSKFLNFSGHFYPDFSKRPLAKTQEQGKQGQKGKNF